MYRNKYVCLWDYMINDNENEAENKKNRSYRYYINRLGSDMDTN